MQNSLSSTLPMNQVDGAGLESSEAGGDDAELGDNKSVIVVLVGVC